MERTKPGRQNIDPRVQNGQTCHAITSCLPWTYSSAVKLWGAENWCILEKLVRKNNVLAMTVTTKKMHLEKNSTQAHTHKKISIYSQNSVIVWHLMNRVQSLGQHADQLLVRMCNMFQIRNVPANTAPPNAFSCKPSESIQTFKMF